MTSQTDDEPAVTDGDLESPVFDQIARAMAESIARIDRNLAYMDGVLQKLADARPPE